MKLSRRLIPAFAMLLVSAVLMSTASFAWFSIGTQATAEGMTVTATADSSLVIKGSEDSYFTNAGKNDLASSLKPATSFDGDNFAKLNVLVGSAHSANANWSDEDEDGNKVFKDGDLVTIPTAELGTYVLTSTYIIKNIGSKAGVYVSDIKIQNTEKTSGKLLPTFRVAVKIVPLNSTTGEDGKVTVTEGAALADTLVFNPMGGQNLDEGVGKYDGAKWTLDDKTYDGGKATSTSSAVYSSETELGELDADTEYKVYIYIWMEGQDAACTSDNVDLSSFDFTVSFSANNRPATKQ